MSRRDPRVTPGFLDCVEKNGRRRCVEAVTVLGDVIYTTGSGPERKCSMEAWRRWCAGATVMHRNTDLVQIPMEREVCAWRNRLGAHFTHDVEVIRAFARVGLAFLYAEPRARALWLLNEARCQESAGDAEALD